MTSETSRHADETVRNEEYPVYEPEDYQSQDYPLVGRLQVWDPGLQRTMDSKQSAVPEDAIVIEVDTMFVDREFLIPVIDVRTSLVDEVVTASHVCLGGSYPGVHVIFPVTNEEYIEYRRAFTKEKEEYRLRDGPAPAPGETDQKVIWVQDPEDQPALAERLTP